jgi:hypothetical protein
MRGIFSHGLLVLAAFQAVLICGQAALSHVPAREWMLGVIWEDPALLTLSTHMGRLDTIGERTRDCANVAGMTRREPCLEPDSGETGRLSLIVLDESAYSDILVQVNAAPTGSLMFGAGINADAGLVGSTVLSPTPPSQATRGTQDR